ncbi:MAG TPA: phenylalanine--tRNA ligase subunit beta [Pyrinomonadaceae bacterium]|nr:phenylalanine--tRNA ligase subunit beta [Pyrinomonadaceae bacterium]
MDISYNWLRDLVDLEASPREVAERLTMAGLAVDAVKEEEGDFVLEFDLTSNRPDCLSHFGVAREAATLFGAAVRMPGTAAARTVGRAGELTSVEIADPDLCPRYSARVVRGVKIGPSPDWLVRRLRAIGQRPINNVADITNFVMHELGQPLHAFDLSKLAGQRIVVRRARAGEKIKTLDGVERPLGPEMLVIADAERAVAVAGVMGGEETEISDATFDVLVESAYFEPQSVRRTSKALGLSTDASYRFERGTDPEGVLAASGRCVALICELAGGTATEDAIDVYPRPFAPPVVALRPRRVGELTGLDVPADEAERVLVSLGFRTVAGGVGVADDGGSRAYTVPAWRTDVRIEEDLIEEVARVVGYERIAEALPPAGAAGEYLAGDARRRSARRVLTALGFDEAVNISFIDAANAGRFDLLPSLGVEGESDAGSFVTLGNPIIEGASLMRPTVLAGLLDSVRRNFNHGTRDVRLFEMGHVFASGDDDSGRPAEPEAFALVVTGEVLEAGRATGRAADFYDLKGAFEAAFDAMGLGEISFEPARVRHLREGQSARVLLAGETVGTLGRLTEELASAYKFRQPVFVGEADLSALLAAPERPARYRPLPRFPSVVRDVSLVADRKVTFAEMRDAVLGLGAVECRGVTLVDVFEGSSLPEGKRSVTLRVEYRSDERTLRDEEADAVHRRALAALEERLGAVQRQ